jgi:hypothetical protein
MHEWQELDPAPLQCTTKAGYVAIGKVYLNFQRNFSSRPLKQLTV